LTGADLAASEFLTDAVVVMSEDELVHDIERRRDRANAVAEQARSLLDTQPNNALMMCMCTDYLLDATKHWIVDD
jgi:ABC-type dipeptide/oligopeptide/nickel transport system ATPase subunit